MQKTTIPDTQLFGVEIEHIYEYGSDLQEAANELRQIPNTDCTGDGSLSGYGLETKSNGPMNLTNLEEWLTNVTEVMRNHNASINRSCGLHVHLDIRPYAQDAEKLAQIWMTFIAVEDVLFASQPPSRRANSYCKSITNEYNFIETARKDKRKDFLRNKPSSKYDAISLYHSDSYGSLEVRIGAGSTDKDKIMEWTMILGQIMAYAVSDQFSWKKIKELLAANVSKNKLLKMQGIMGTSYQVLVRMITERNGWDFTMNWSKTLTQKEEIARRIRIMREESIRLQQAVNELQDAKRYLARNKLEKIAQRVEKEQERVRVRAEKRRKQLSEIVEKNPERVVTKTNVLDQRGLF